MVSASANGSHWKVVCGLGTKVLTLTWTSVLRPPICRAQTPYLVRQVDDGLDVVVRFAGQPHHKVELDGAPAAGEDLLRDGQQVFGGDVFVDAAAQRVAAGLRREGEAGVAASATAYPPVSTEKDSMRRLGREMEDAGP